MKVVSKLVELDFEVCRIEASKTGIVVMNDPAVAMGTKVYITPADAMTIARVILASGAGLRFLLTFPFRHLYHRLRGNAASQPGGPGGPGKPGGSKNKPWNPQ